MPSNEFDPLADQVFLRWAEYVSEELWISLGDVNRSDDYLNFLWSVFEGNGEVPPNYLATLIQDRRATVAKYYLDYLLEKARRDTRLDIEEAFWISPPDRLEPAGLVHVGNTVIHSIRKLDIAEEVAEAVQDYLMDRYWRVWPVCPSHGLGYHPVSTDSGPQWECSQGGHRVPVISDRGIDPDASASRPGRRGPRGAGHRPTSFD